MHRFAAPCGFCSLFVGILAVGLTGALQAQGPAGSVYHPVTLSQSIECQVVDRAIAAIPQGDGAAPTTADELGPGGWRFGVDGTSFVTFIFGINADETGYEWVAGRSAFGGNASNDYPANFNLAAGSISDVLTFSGKRAELTLSGDNDDPPVFAVPGPGSGRIHISLRDLDGDGGYEGCVRRPFLKNQGDLRPEGGEYLEQEYYKVFAFAEEDGTVVYWEFTEITTFNNTLPNGL